MAGFLSDENPSSVHSFDEGFVSRRVGTMNPVSEIELKFGLSDAAADAVDAALRRRGAKVTTIRSRYWDSADRRLARAGVSLRVRRSGDRWEQTVKGAGASPVERLEETVPRPGDWGEDGPPAEPWYHAGNKAGALLDRALSRRGGRVPALEPVFTSVVERRAMHVVMPGADVEVAFDRGAVHAGDRSLPVCEVELELKHGDVGALIELGRGSVEAHGMWLSTIAKSARGERLAGGSAASQATKAKPPRLGDATSGAAIFRAVVRSCVDQVLANASVIAAGDVDDDAVHQLRIGLRRLRTAWRELGAWRGSLGPEWEVSAAEVFRGLGAYRDRQTVAASMQHRLAAAGSPEPALRLVVAHAIDPVALVRAKAFQHALLDLLAYLLEPLPGTRGSDARGGGDGADDKPPEEVIGRNLARLHARLKHDAKRFESLGELDRHRVRKRLKRLRYLSELVGSLYKSGKVERFLHALEPAQDELGRYMDLVVATRLAKEGVDAGDARAWFNVGWLQAQLPRAVERCGKALGRVSAAEPFWHAASPRRK